MQPIQFFAARAEDGALLPGATIDVYLAGTQTRATLFSDNSETPLGNPAYADASAKVFVYTSAERVDIQVSKGGYAAPLLRDILVVDVTEVLVEIQDLNSQVAQSAINAAASASSAQAAGERYANTADALSSGVYSLDSLVAGSGGTEGIYALAFTGGAGSGAAGWFTVVSGAVSAYEITARGRGYTSAPTVSFAAAPGLTGASATVVISANREVGQSFTVPSSSVYGYVDLYEVIEGPEANYIDTQPNKQAIEGRVNANPRDGIVGYIQAWTDKALRVAGGWKRGGVWSAKTVQAGQASEIARDGAYGTPLAADSDGRTAIAVNTKGESYIWKFAARTEQMIRDLISAGGSSAEHIAGFAGYDHRNFDDNNYLMTMPTFFGPVDVIVPKTGNGIRFAATSKPIENLSYSGQSNVGAGGASNNLRTILLGIRDAHRAMGIKGSRNWGDTPIEYQPGDIAELTSAGQDAEFINGVASWTPDCIQFSIVAMDSQPLSTLNSTEQRVYVQITSNEGGTPLTEFMAGTTKGDNIAQMIPATSSMLAGVYGKESIMYAHFLIGHEAGPDDGDGGANPTYGALLSAFADEVCGYGEALPGNIAAGVRPKVLTYQPNNRNSDAFDETNVPLTCVQALATSLADPDVVCIGPVYGEIAVDSGIHMSYKLQTGELFAHVYRLIREGEDFIPLYVSAAVLDGDEITCTIDGPEGLVTEDTDWLRGGVPPENFGIYFDDDTSSAAITSVEIVNTSASARELLITLDGVPSGSNPKLYIGGTNNGVGAPDRDNTWAGGLCSLYVKGPRSFWYAKGFTEACTPEIRFRLCRDIVSVS